MQYVFLFEVYGDFVMLMYNYRKQIQEINWQRKNEQTDAGAKLKQLEERWSSFGVQKTIILKRN